MRSVKSALCLIGTLFVLASCEKDQSNDFTSTTSSGTLKKSASGDCSPITVDGLFKEAVPLNNSSYVDVQVNVTAKGTYSISTDTLNGFFFNRSGALGTGLHTVRLYAHGQPITGGTNTFNVRYGNSTCSFNVTVTGTSVPAVFTLGGSPGACTGFVTNGIYTSGTPLSSSNNVSLTVNVTTPGSYSISTNTVNGIIFSASGQFSAPGSQTVTLTGSGTPAAAGNFPFTVNSTNGNCSFSLTVVGPAVYTLGGAGGTCTGFVLAGPYFAGIPLTAANTVTLNVNVTVTGAYNISSTTVNGVSFSKSGTFTTTGAQTVVLNGTGTPTSAGNFTYPVTGNASTCNFSLTVNTTPAGTCTFNCGSSTVNGTYYVGTALGASNTISLSVNVTSIGTYNISSGAPVNGISFSKTGVFASTGIQTITLTGTGTPAAAGSNNYVVTFGANTCTFSINAATPPAAIMSCKINGVFVSFAEDAHTEIDYNIFGTSETLLTISGRLLPLGNPSDTYTLTISKPAGGSIPAGVYNQNTFINSGGAYKVGMEYYIELTAGHWSVTDNTPFNPQPAFTINITTLTANRCIGTFSGTIKENFGTGPGSKTITEGVFDVPVQ
jgi:hypothetical protein